jgi:stage II sporulation protein D
LAITGRTSFNLAADQEVRVVAVGAGVGLQGRGEGAADEIRFESADGGRLILVNGRPYRGTVVAYARGGSLYAVNEVGIEAYLRGVIDAEMGSRSPNEMAALEAQAIVSRTYALANRGRFRTDGYDIRATVTDQAYVGAGRESPLGVRAVANTAGLVVTYDGRPASVFYHSTCGYSTAHPSEVFRSVRGVEYLRPVSDRRPSGGYYCDISPRFRWRVEWDGAELRNILRGTVPSVLGVEQSVMDVVRDVYTHQTGRSGRVTEMRISVSSGEVPVFGPDVRRVLQTPEGRMLGSNSVEFTATKNEAGVVEHLMVTGAGWGHGVGMCQWGAVGRARSGQSATAIISAYFPGTRIERWY